MTNRLPLTVSDSSLRHRIAKKGFPAGAVVRCELCGYRRLITPEEVAELLSAWPKHCGFKMQIDAVT